MCGGCGQRGPGDWLSLAVRTHVQRVEIAAAASQVILRVRVSVTSSGWLVSSATGRSAVADTITALWSSIRRFAGTEPDWHAVRALPMSMGPAPEVDRRAVIHLDVGDYRSARAQVDELTAPPDVHRIRVGSVCGGDRQDSRPWLRALLAEQVPSLTLAAFLVSGLLEYGHGRRCVVECTASSEDGVAHLLTWDGTGLSCAVS